MFVVKVARIWRLISFCASFLKTGPCLDPLRCRPFCVLFSPCLCFCMFAVVKIRFFLLQNRQGKTRLSKWYVPPPTQTTSGTTANAEAEKVRIEAECHRLVTARDKKYTNFIEYNSYKLIYRRYAGLFFTIAVDVTDNELSYLETIHLFVKTN